MASLDNCGALMNEACVKGVSAEEECLKENRSDCFGKDLLPDQHGKEELHDDAINSAPEDAVYIGMYDEEEPALDDAIEEIQNLSNAFAGFHHQLQRGALLRDSVRKSNQLEVGVTDDSTLPNREALKEAEVEDKTLAVKAEDMDIWIKALQRVEQKLARLRSNRVFLPHKFSRNVGRALADQRIASINDEGAVAVTDWIGQSLLDHRELPESVVISNYDGEVADSVFDEERESRYSYGPSEMSESGRVSGAKSVNHNLFSAVSPGGTLLPEAVSNNLRTPFDSSCSSPESSQPGSPNEDDDRHPVLSSLINSLNIDDALCDTRCHVSPSCHSTHSMREMLSSSPAATGVQEDNRGSDLNTHLYESNVSCDKESVIAPLRNSTTNDHLTPSQIERMIDYRESCASSQFTRQLKTPEHTSDSLGSRRKNSTNSSSESSGIYPSASTPRVIFTRSISPSQQPVRSSSRNLDRSPDLPQTKCVTSRSLELRSRSISRPEESSAADDVINSTVNPVKLFEDNQSSSKTSSEAIAFRESSEDVQKCIAATSSPAPPLKDQSSVQILNPLDINLRYGQSQELATPKELGTFDTNGTYGSNSTQGELSSPSLLRAQAPTIVFGELGASAASPGSDLSSYNKSQMRADEPNTLKALQRLKFQTLTPIRAHKRGSSIDSFVTALSPSSSLSGASHDSHASIGNADMSGIFECENCKAKLSGDNLSKTRFCPVQLVEQLKRKIKPKKGKHTEPEEAFLSKLFALTPNEIKRTAMLLSTPERSPHQTRSQTEEKTRFYYGNITPLGRCPELGHFWPGVGSWSFDIFELHRATSNHSLAVLMMYIAERHDFFHRFNISVTKYIALVRRIEDGYNDNPYHNSLHAADVLQNVYSLYLSGTISHRNSVDSPSSCGCQCHQKSTTSPGGNHTLFKTNPSVGGVTPMQPLRMRRLSITNPTLPSGTQSGTPGGTPSSNTNQLPPAKTTARTGRLIRDERSMPSNSMPSSVSLLLSSPHSGQNASHGTCSSCPCGLKVSNGEKFTPPPISSCLLGIDLLYLTLAAAAHDIGHVGVTNQFLVDSDHPLALTYNDQAVMEHFHSASLFCILRDPICNIFSNFSRIDYSEARQFIIDMILATDMKRHLAMVSNLQTTFESKISRRTWFSPHVRSDRLVILEMLVHASDVANPSKPHDLARKWANSIRDEWFRQAEIERASGLPVTPMMEPSTFSLSKSQIGFIDFIVMPLFEAVAQCIPEIGKQSLTNIELNRQMWIKERDLEERMQSPNI